LSQISLILSRGYMPESGSVANKVTTPLYELK
jgi:hypothetical protein